MSRKPAPHAPSASLDDRLCFAIHSTGFAFSRVYREPLRRLGVTYPQYLVMLALWEEDGVTVGRLGERLFLETNTLTPLLKRLETLGLLSRRRSDADERRVLVALTAEGRALRREVDDVMRCVGEATGLKPVDIGRLTKEIQALRSNLERSFASSQESKQKRRAV